MLVLSVRKYRRAGIVALSMAECVLEWLLLSDHGLGGLANVSMDSISGGWLAITIAIRWGYHRWWYSLVRTTTAWCILSCPLLLLTIYPRLYMAQHRSMHDCTRRVGVCTVLLSRTLEGAHPPRRRRMYVCNVHALYPVHST